MDTGRSTVKSCLDQSPDEAHTAAPIRAPKLRYKLDEKASIALNSFNSNLSQAASMYLAAFNGDDAPTEFPDHVLKRVSPAMHSLLTIMSSQFLEAQKEFSHIRALNTEPRQTYASVTVNKSITEKTASRPQPAPRKSKSSHVVLIKAKAGPDTSLLNVQEEVMKAFDPVSLGIGVTAIRTATNGDVRVIVSSASDSNIVKNSISSSAISSKIEVSLPIKLRPRIIVFNIESSISSNTFRTGLTSQNPDIRSAIGSDDLSLKFVREISKRGSDTHKHMIFETSPAVFNAFHKNKRVFSGHSSYRFEETLRVRQCFKCGKFGHIAENCRSNIACSHCSGSHDQKDCPDKLKPDSAK